MNIIIRADSSVEIGSGHIMRCLTLAKQLERNGYDITFISRNFIGNINSLIINQGFNLISLPSSETKEHWKWLMENWIQDLEETREYIRMANIIPELIIIDNYGLDYKWENGIRLDKCKIAVIDDLANRKHECDLLIDQNYYLDMEERYMKLVPSSCKKLLGPNFVLLRDEFLEIDLTKLNRDKKINKILVFFGGSDQTGETLKTILAIKELEVSYLEGLEFIIVVGNANPHKELIREQCVGLPNTQLLYQVNNMGELMLNADLFIGAGGTTTWERCYLQLPSIVSIIADNQREVIDALEQQGSIISLGEAKYITKDTIKKTIKMCLENPEKVIQLSKKCRELIDPNLIKQKIVSKEIGKLKDF